MLAGDEVTGKALDDRVGVAVMLSTLKRMGAARRHDLQHMSKKAPTFREEMNCQPKSLSIQAISKSVPTGSGEFTPDKPIKRV